MIKRILCGLFLLLLLINSVKAHSADSVPVIRCVAVDPSGNVTLTWSIPNPADTVGTFFHYEIFAASSLPGPYPSVGTTTIFGWNSFSYINGNINSAPNPYYFYVVIDTIPTGNTPAYDTVESIKVNHTLTGNGIITLTWNAIRTPNLSSSTGWYRIYKEYPTGVWTLKDSTQGLTYQDTAIFCHQWLGYYVEIEDTNVNCFSISTRDSVLIQDNTPPAPVIIDSVSYDPATGFVNIGWEPDTSQDTQGYEIYEYFAGGILSPIQYIPGINNTIYSFLDTDSKLDSFIVVAKDSCGNLSSPSSIQTSIYLNKTTNACNDVITLNWNPYINWANGVSKYYIFVSINNGPFNLLDSVANNVTTYSDFNLAQFTTYCFYIMALEGGNNDITSRSNEVCITANLANVPQFGYIKTATVTNSSQVRLDLYTDITAQVLQYKFLRAVNPAGPFDTIVTIGPNFISQFSIDDNTADPNDTSYYYCFVVLDSCGNITFTSNIARTILLKTSSNPDMSNTLTWNDYSGFLGGVNSYLIYRSIDGILNPTPITTIPFGGTNVYRDYVNNFVSSQGNFCYYIEALEGPNNPYFFMDTSFSNSPCTAPDPLLFVPNAFTPDGRNPEFLPIAGFTDVHLYDFRIWSRWGDVIFESKDPKQGWDGTFKGKPAPEGVYFWVVELSGSGDAQIKRAGTVNLIR